VWWGGQSGAVGEAVPVHQLNRGLRAWPSPDLAHAAGDSVSP